MIVDDSATILMSLEIAFDMNGLSTEKAASAEEAQLQAHRATGLRVLKTERIAEAV